MRGSEFFELRAFACIVECGSFAAAAQLLDITPSALSQTLKRLEKRLNARLIHRTTRSLSATDSGLRLLGRLKPALAEIDAAQQDVIHLQNVTAGTLRLHIPRLAARTFLEPLLEPFCRAYPDIVLDVTVDDEVSNIVNRGFDLGIRLGKLLENEMVALPIGPSLRHIPVASPAYLSEHGTPLKPEDLLAHRCINWRQHGNHGLQAWEFRRKNGKALSIAVQGPLIVSERNLALTAALRGVGIAFVAEGLAQPFIREGKLSLLLDAWCPRFPGWHLFYHKQRQTPATVMAFVDFLKRQPGEQ